jgi:hypothetical protein
MTPVVWTGQPAIPFLVRAIPWHLSQANSLISIGVKVDSLPARHGSAPAFARAGFDRATSLDVVLMQVARSSRIRANLTSFKAGIAADSVIPGSKPGEDA